MAYSYLSPENTATEKGHASGTAQTALLGSTAPTTYASNTGHTAQATRTDIGHAETHSEHTSHGTSHSSHSSLHGTGITLQQPGSNPEMIVQLKVDLGELMECEEGTMRQQIPENDRNSPAALHSTQDLQGMESDISGSIDTVASIPLKGCGRSKDSDDDDDGRRKRMQIIAYQLSSVRSSNLADEANGEDLHGILPGLEVVAMSLPHDDGDSRSSRVGDSTIDVLVLPEQLTRQSPVPDGGGCRDRDGGGMWESDSNHIGSGGGFNCEQDVRSSGGDLSDCAHWRGSNRQPLQPQLSSSVYRVGCPAGDGFRSRQESDVARMPNQPRSLGVQAVEEQVENSVMLVFAEPGDRYGTVMLKVVPDYCGAVLTAPFSEQRHIEPSTHNNGPALESIDHRQRERDALRLQSWWHGGNHRKRFLALLLSELSGRTLMWSKTSRRLPSYGP
ncbi:AGAP003703-PA-like protein [Anopheles sinensis]|uniref:AGAP003703-PA-like protein n=1 Tax=Anopheles sinensis TaxID=74873 RepID=A0A084VWK7_ANOSI|nr:AGAP003703-PA-like protein [Anopheles sinensis]